MFQTVLPETQSKSYKFSHSNGGGSCDGNEPAEVPWSTFPSKHDMDILG